MAPSWLPARSVTDDDTELASTCAQEIADYIWSRHTEFKTELETGVSAQVLQINLPAGDYSYVCDLHPNMTGTLTVQ